MADLGRKHVCFKCSTKFYDMKKSVVLCPKCGANQADAPVQVIAAPPPPSAPAKRAPKMVDPPEEEPADEEEAVPGAELDLDAGEEDADVPDEDLDKPAGEDSFD